MQPTTKSEQFRGGFVLKSRHVKPCIGSCLIISYLRIGVVGVCALLYGGSFATYAAQPSDHTLLNSGSYSPTTGNIFDNVFALRGDMEQVEPQPQIKMGNKVAIRTSFEAEKMPDEVVPEIEVQPHLSNSNSLDRLMSSYQSQGLKINRLSATWVSDVGTFTVGNDWSNFQDFQPTREHGSGYSAGLDEKQTAKQIAWVSHNGFSIALEESNNDFVEDENVATSIADPQSLRTNPPNLILSWQGQIADQTGHYKLSVLGRELELKSVHNDVVVDDSTLGWGVKFGGGWRFGDLFTALNVTLGDGIDSLILKRFGRDVSVSASGQTKTTKSFSILPSLNYSLGQHADFHVAVGRYQSMEDQAAADGIDTLDTINLGYTWSPWPSTKFKVEVVSKDFEGISNEEDSAEIKIGAQKSF